MGLKLDVNGAVREVDASGDTPLLWVLRDFLQLNGTKYGCGMAQCGACQLRSPRASGGSRRLAHAWAGGEARLRRAHAAGTLRAGQGREAQRWKGYEGVARAPEHVPRDVGLGSRQRAESGYDAICDLRGCVGTVGGRRCALPGLRASLARPVARQSAPLRWELEPRAARATTVSTHARAAPRGIGCIETVVVRLSARSRGLNTHVTVTSRDRSYPRTSRTRRRWPGSPGARW